MLLVLFINFLEIHSYERIAEIIKKFIILSKIAYTTIAFFILLHIL